MTLRPIGTRYTSWTRPPLPITDSISTSESRSTAPTHAKRVTWEVVGYVGNHERVEMISAVAYRARWIMNVTRDTYDWKLIPEYEIDGGYYEPIKFIDDDIDCSEAAVVEVDDVRWS